MKDQIDLSEMESIPKLNANVFFDYIVFGVNQAMICGMKLGAKLINYHIGKIL